MSSYFLTFFTLIWPVIVAGVLVVISRAFIAEFLHSRRSGRPMI